MRLFLDSANLDELKQALALGLVDGITTNPSLLAKEGGDWEKKVKEICHLVKGPISLEVTSMHTEGMLEEAKKLITFAPNVVIKVPMTHEGLKAVKVLHKMEIETNVTLVFSPVQALLAARAGASYVSPFVGRLDALSQDSRILISEIMTIFKNYDYKTQVIVASVRHPNHVADAALLGAHAATVPFNVLTSLVKHPLTDSGLQAFLNDWKSVEKK